MLQQGSTSRRVGHEKGLLDRTQAQQHVDEIGVGPLAPMEVGGPERTGPPPPSCALHRRDGPAPLSIPGGEVIAVLAILACLAIVATASWQAVRDVLIVLAIGLAIRALVRQREVP